MRTEVRLALFCPICCIYWEQNIDFSQEDFKQQLNTSALREIFAKNILNLMLRTQQPFPQELPGVSKKYPLLTGNKNETIRYYYSPSGQLNLSIFNLDSNTLHLEIVHQTPKIQACEVKIYSAPETRGFEKGLSYDLYRGYFPKYLF